MFYLQNMPFLGFEFFCISRFSDSMYQPRYESIVEWYVLRIANKLFVAHHPVVLVVQ